MNALENDLVISKNNRKIEHFEKESNALFGFWVYLMTDCVLFASLFATFVVLRNNNFGGPSGAQLFSLPYVLLETLVLLTSSFTNGLALLSAQRRHVKQTLIWLGVTFILGATFLTLELSEFHKFARMGDSWQRSGFLSAYYTLVGTHGAHISIGLLWMAVMAIYVIKRGLTNLTIKRIRMLSLFWHFLDVVWIFIFTIVYLFGALHA
ncbi:MAG: cytochrome o ubiquinol oxidase subunit III [Candidatus Saccharimonadales bacterium]